MDQSASPTAAATTASASDRASLRTMRQRRRRVWRNLLTFAVVTALMVVLVMARRDQQEVDRCLQSVRFFVKALESDEARRGGAPINLPKASSETAMDRSHYHYSLRNARSSRTAGTPIGVICCDHPHRLFTRTDGRHVVVADGPSLRVEWMSEDDYQRRAAELQLPAHMMDVSTP